MGLLAPLDLAVGFGIFGYYPYIGERQSMYLLPVLYLLVGMGLDYIAAIDRKRIFFSALLIMVLALAGSYARDRLESTRLSRGQVSWYSNCRQET